MNDCKMAGKLAYLQENNHVCMTAGKTASMMSCLQASLKDDKLDVMQSGMTDGQQDGWH